MSCPVSTVLALLHSYLRSFSVTPLGLLSSPPRSKNPTHAERSPSGWESTVTRRKSIVAAGVCATADGAYRGTVAGTISRQIPHSAPRLQQTPRFRRTCRVPPPMPSRGTDRPSPSLRRPQMPSSCAACMMLYLLHLSVPLSSGYVPTAPRPAHGGLTGTTAVCGGIFHSPPCLSMLPLQASIPLADRAAAEAPPSCPATARRTRAASVRILIPVMDVPTRLCRPAPPETADACSAASAAQAAPGARSRGCEVSPSDAPTRTAPAPGAPRF